MLKSKFKVHTQNVSETKVAAELLLGVAISKLRGYMYNMEHGYNIFWKTPSTNRTSSYLGRYISGGQTAPASSPPCFVLHITKTHVSSSIGFLMICQQNGDKQYRYEFRAKQFTTEHLQYYRYCI